MLFAVAAFFALGYPAAQVSKSDITTGLYLFHACKAVDIEHPTTLQTRDSTICLVYINGFNDGETINGRYACSGRASLVDLAHTYVAYMRKHPEAMKMDKAASLFIALHSAYPCQDK